uniref:WD_REPEATS_REGION domain-containing protein n=1 Tax=Caenorhabditis tropicalis TaxID=1561998 RepID=A0A1I7UGN6_9PELO
MMTTFQSSFSSIHQKRASPSSVSIIIPVLFFFFFFLEQKTTNLLASGSNEGELKLWKIAENFRGLTPFFSYTIPGFINSINFAANGKSLVVGAGKEHKDGRWWVDREARNQVVILPIRYTDGSNETADEQITSSGARHVESGGIESGESDDEDVEEKEKEEEEDEIVPDSEGNEED